jgi:ubiquinone/menaquinone biosynthesis C-methylase UbiE
MSTTNVRLPLPDGAADLAIAFVSLHDFDEVRAAAAEVARVLAPDGRFCVALLHPAVSARMVDHLRGRLLNPAGNEDLAAG